MKLFMFAHKHIAVGWMLAIPYVLLVAVPFAFDYLRGYVMRDWTVTEWHTEGEDVVLSGWMSKHWNCTLRLPHRATDTAKNVYVVFSDSPTAPVHWPADGKPKNFGQWRIQGGAGKVLSFYTEHDCGLGTLPAISQLGTLDTTTK